MDKCEPVWFPVEVEGERGEMLQGGVLLSIFISKLINHVNASKTMISRGILKKQRMVRFLYCFPEESI